jgi:hypothetical protein
MTQDGYSMTVRRVPVVLPSGFTPLGYGFEGGLLKR